MGSFLLVSALFATATGMRAVGMAKPVLCAPEIVQETCRLLTSDETKDSINADDLQAVLSSNAESIVHAWQLLGLPGQASMITRSSKVTCAELCQTLTKTAAEWQWGLPPSSDLGCYAHDGEVTCDVDLSPERISMLVPKDMEIPDMHDNKLVVHHKAAEPVEKKAKWPPLDNIDKEAKQRAAEELSYTVEQVTERLLNLFRMFPTQKVAAEIPSSLMQTGSHLTSNNTSWRKEVVTRNLEAVAYVNQAIRKFKARQTRDAITTWFGPGAYTNRVIRNEVQRVLNSVHEMLDNVEYVYPGDDCSENVYAYVYPSGAQSTNDQGKKMFHLCDLYFESSTSEQVETLTHEGSHHATAYTTDVCMEDSFYVRKQNSSPNLRRGGIFVVDGEDMEAVSITEDEVIFEPFSKTCDHTAYGRSTCTRLARDSPDLALLNADNFCYYIQDVTDEAKSSSAWGKLRDSVTSDKS